MSSSSSQPGRLSKSRNSTSESQWADCYPENTGGDQHNPAKPLGKVWKEESSSLTQGPQAVPDLIAENGLKIVVTMTVAHSSGHPPYSVKTALGSSSYTVLTDTVPGCTRPLTASNTVKQNNGKKPGH